MTKFEYFIYAINNNLYLQRAWLLSTFGIVKEDYKNSYFEITNKNLMVKIKKENTETLEKIIDFKVGKPIFGKDELITIPNNTLSFIEGKQDSTYGIFLINCLFFWYPYQGKVKYLNGYISPNQINEIAFNLLKDNKVTVAEHVKFENAASMITCLSQVSVPSASRKSITPNPKIKKLKRDLLEKNKDRLTDPAVIVEITNEIIKADKEYLKGDPSMGFFIRDKNFNITRLKTMGMYGAEPDYYDETKLNIMETSLTEGWSKDNIEMLYNNLRAGSYARGKETALGGESTKVTSRIFQNYKIDIDDCNTTNGLEIILNDVNYKQFQERYLVGSTTPLDLKELEKLMKKGLPVLIRSPAYCKATGTSYCKKCMGDKVLQSGLGLNSQTIILTSTFMEVAMQLTHGRTLKVKKYNYLERIT